MDAAEREERILALDIGRRRTGLAVSDPTATLATPLSTVTLTPQALVRHVRDLVAERDITRILIGWPRRSGGEPGEIAALARRIGEALARATGRPVVYWDETLTSWAAEERLREREAARGRPRRGARVPSRQARERRRAEIDRLAATVLLEDYLASRRQERRPRGPAEG